MAASVPTWVARHPGPEGEFLRGAEIHKQWVTSSGYMSCVSASGKLLGRQPTADVLEAFQALPASEREPGAVQVPPLPEADRVIPAPPADGLVLRVHARFLAKDKSGELRAADVTDFPLMVESPGTQRTWKTFLQPNTEFMWLTSRESQSLIPANPESGMKLNVDADLVQRMARFHLTPQRATTSEGGIIRQSSVKSASLDVVVTEVTADRIRMKAEGRIHWGSDYEPELATTPNGPLKQGFETLIMGRLEYDRRNKVWTRFDLVAPGEVWGRWGDANGNSMVVERPGRGPFGFAFELADPTRPTDRIPPGGNGRYLEGTEYFSK